MQSVIHPLSWRSVTPCKCDVGVEEFDVEEEKLEMFIGRSHLFLECSLCESF